MFQPLPINFLSLRITSELIELQIRGCAKIEDNFIQITILM